MIDVTMNRCGEAAVLGGDFRKCFHRRCGVTAVQVEPEASFTMRDTAFHEASNLRHGPRSGSLHGSDHILALDLGDSTAFGH